MLIEIRTSFDDLVWYGNVRSKVAANRKTGEFIKSTGYSCVWKEVGVGTTTYTAYNPRGRAVQVTVPLK